MKIINKGEYWHRICKSCGCEFEFDLRDITETERMTSQFQSNIIKYVRCPMCNEEVLLDKK